MKVHLHGGPMDSQVLEVEATTRIWIREAGRAAGASGIGVAENEPRSGTYGRRLGFNDPWEFDWQGWEE